MLTVVVLRARGGLAGARFDAGVDREQPRGRGALMALQQHASTSRIVPGMRYFAGATMLASLLLAGCSSTDEAAETTPTSPTVTESSPSPSEVTPDPSESEASEVPEAVTTPVPGTEPASPEVLDLFSDAQLGDPIEVVQALQLPLTSAVSDTTRYLAVAKAVDVTGTDTYVALTVVFTSAGGASYSRIDASTTQYQNMLTYSGLMPYEGSDVEDLVTQADGMAVELGAMPMDAMD